MSLFRLLVAAFVKTGLNETFPPITSNKFYAMMITHDDVGVIELGLLMTLIASRYMLFAAFISDAFGFV